MNTDRRAWSAGYFSYNHSVTYVAQVLEPGHRLRPGAHPADRRPGVGQPVAAPSGLGHPASPPRPERAGVPGTATTRRSHRTAKRQVAPSSLPAETGRLLGANPGGSSLRSATRG